MLKKILVLILSLSAYLIAWEGYDAANSSYISLKSTYSKNEKSFIKIYDHGDFKEKELLVTNIRRSSSFYIINVYDSYTNEKRMFEMSVPERKSLPVSVSATRVDDEGEKITLGEVWDKINIFKYLKTIQE